jgi:hypothetical protein
MKKINKNILDHLGLSTTVFKYPVYKGSIENLFDPNIDSDFKKYMLIKKESGQVRLSEEFSFTHENPDKILNIKEGDLLDGTWWVLP